LWLIRAVEGERDALAFRARCWRGFRRSRSARKAVDGVGIIGRWVPLMLLGYRMLLMLLGYWVLGAANAARLWDAAITLLGCWVLGAADTAG
jgi:hypothetical protein